MFSLRAMFGTAVVVTLALFHQTSAFVAPPLAMAPQASSASSSAVHRVVKRLPPTTARMSAGHPHPPHPPHPPRGIQEAWNGHFEAFNAKDLERILQDYDENSVITTFNQVSDTKNVYKGVEGARSLFTGLFTVVSDMSEMTTLTLDLDAESRTGFFVWRCPTAGFQDGTDTFVFGPNNKIHRQTAVVRTG